MKKLYLLWSISWLPVAIAHAQTGTISGKIRANGSGLPFASVAISGTPLGASTDKQGNFTIPNVVAGQHLLVISSIGYQTIRKSVSVVADTTTSVSFELVPSDVQLGEVVVTGTMKETSVADSPVKVEVISSRFFQRNRSNNLTEAIFNVNGIQEQVACGVCGTNSIRINGLEGPYTMVLIDGMPIMGALSSVYGLNGIPTQAIDRIEIVKGPNSTLYGSESIAGVINVITERPDHMPLLTFDAFATSHLENNLDFAISPKTRRFSTMLTGNVYYNNQFRDDNGDDFADFTLNKRVSLYNRWTFHRPSQKRFDVSGKFYYEDRAGGTRQFFERGVRETRGSGEIYGESIYTKRVELIGTYELPVAEKIRLDFSYNTHDQNSYYGNTLYDAQQHILFSNLIWDKSFGNNDFLLGISNRYQYYNDNTPATSGERITGNDTTYADRPDRQYIPGVFVQNEFKLSPVWSVLAGARVDYYPEHGLIPSPRLNVKWNASEKSTVRLNFGTGFRIVNLFTEDHAALSGFRQVVLADELRPESSYNVALNYNYNYAIGESAGSVDVDAFYTYFTNRIVPDYTTNQNQIIYDNSDGYATTRGVAVSVVHNFLFPLSVSVGATVQDVFEMTQDGEGNPERREILFAPDVSGVFTASYLLKKWGVSVDWTGRVVGPQDLPAYDPPYQRPTRSPWYTLQNVQVTKKFNDRFSVYGGVKNLWNWTQPSPLIAPDAPFSNAFDTAYAYGPLQTRRVYLGVRWEMEGRK